MGELQGKELAEAKGGGSQQVIEVRDRGKQWTTGGSSGLQRREPTQTLRSPTLGLRRETRRQAQEPTETDQGVR